MRNRLLLLAVTGLLLGSSSAQNPPDSGIPPAQAAQSEEFSDRALNHVLHDMKEAMEGHNVQAVFSSFDEGKMDGYLQFEGQLEQFLSKYDAFRLRYRIVQTDAEGPKGIALVEMQMEAEPRDAGGIQLRRDRQIRFEFEPSKKGWKIVDLSPREFFAP